MDLQSLPKITHKKNKRIGQGFGSGRGKTAGRGTKGQKARGTVRLGFEGGQIPFIRRLPYKRGFKRIQNRPVVINVENLNVFADGSIVNEQTLVEKGLFLLKNRYGVKILGNGDLMKKLTIEGIPCTKNAIEKIEKMGGQVEL